MKPETILKSDLLDILFENKNKEYGAYALRKNYNKRLMQALGATCLFVALFVLLQSMKPKQEVAELFYTTDSIDLKRFEFKTDDKKPDIPVKPQQPKVIPLANDAAPVIKPDDKVPDSKIPTTEELDKGNLGTKTVVDPGTSDPGTVSVDPHGGGDVQPAAPEIEVPKGPLNFAEVMPSFNGDLKKWILNHVRQPDDLEEGEKIVVKVKFVVTADGEIDDVQVMQSGRKDLDQEVIGVVKRMPRWKPGMQAGRNVPVYFYLPVTFVSNTE
jgi:periplasmic protein TonB